MASIQYIPSDLRTGYHDESETPSALVNDGWGLLRSPKAIKAKKKKKKKKKLKAPVWPEDLPEAPKSHGNDAPNVEITFAGPSMSDGNHVSVVSEAVEAVEAAEVYAEPLPETFREPKPDAYVESEPEMLLDEPVVKYLVSSRHLALSSRYFSAKLSGPWIEAAVKHIDGCYHMDATEWDSEALLILMRVIHGKTRSVPRHMDLEMLAKLAVLVDYYECHEVIEIYCPGWIGSLSDKLPADYGRDMVLWLLISHVFQQYDIFQQMTRVAVLKSADPVRTMELPIPSSLVGKYSIFAPLGLSLISSQIW
ncbi:hypothetical protein SGCOL_001517 [Colletotrichum sp. CLE4]